MDNEFRPNRSQVRESRDRDKNISEIQKVKKRGNFILRQELKNLTPQCNIKFSLICNAILCLIFWIVGIPVLSSAGKSVSFEIPYTDW